MIWKPYKGDNNWHVLDYTDEPPMMLCTCHGSPERQAAMALAIANMPEMVGLGDKAVEMHVITASKALLEDRFQ